MDLKPKYIGISIIFVSLATVAMLLSLGQQLNDQQQAACMAACGSGDEASCTTNACPYHHPNNNILFLGIISVFVAFLGGMGGFLAFTKQEKMIETKYYDVTKLSGQEKEIFSYVKDSKDNVYQSDIVEKFSLSKSKATRILDKLQQRGLIERKRRGMTNVIVAK